MSDFSIEKVTNTVKKNPVPWIIGGILFVGAALFYKANDGGGEGVSMYSGEAPSPGYGGGGGGAMPEVRTQDLLALQEGFQEELTLMKSDIQDSFLTTGEIFSDMILTIREESAQDRYDMSEQFSSLLYEFKEQTTQDRYDMLEMMELQRQQQQQQMYEFQEQTAQERNDIIEMIDILSSRIAQPVYSPSYSSPSYSSPSYSSPSSSSPSSSSSRTAPAPIDLKGSSDERPIQQAYKTGKYQVGDIIAQDNYGKYVVTEKGYRYIPGS